MYTFRRVRWLCCIQVAGTERLRVCVKGNIWRQSRVKRARSCVHCHGHHPCSYQHKRQHWLSVSILVLASLPLFFLNNNFFELPKKQVRTHHHCCCVTVCFCTLCKELHLINLFFT